jgi:hypothetical protein
MARAPAAAAAFDGGRLISYLTVVGVAAASFGFIGYAAALSVGAWFQREIDARAIAEHVFYTTGALGLIVAFGLLAIQG